MEIVPHTKSAWQRSLLELVVIVAILCFVFFIFPQQTRVVLSQAYQRFFPCDAPVTYRIGTIDPRFGLSQAQVLTLLQNAAGKWNTAAGKTVLAYDPSHGVVVVNFVYDYRQNAEDEMSSIDSSVDSGMAQYNDLKEEYAAQQTQYLSDKSAFDSAYASFQNQQDEYNQEVQQWNARGGAPSSTYDQLQSQKAALQTQSSQLEAQQTSLNTEVDSLNSLADEINQLIGALNLNVEKYDAIGATTGSEFEEGVFESSFGEESINIYEYDSTVRLHRVIAHEFGHSLGMEHVSDPQAIMNALNDGTTENPTAADVAELDSVCHL